MCYSRDTEASVAGKVEQVGLDFRKMHDEIYGFANITGKITGVAALVQTNNKIGVNSNALIV